MVLWHQSFLRFIEVASTEWHHERTRLVLLDTSEIACLRGESVWKISLELPPETHQTNYLKTDVLIWSRKELLSVDLELFEERLFNRVYIVARWLNRGSESEEFMLDLLRIRSRLNARRFRDYSLDRRCRRTCRVWRLNVLIKEDVCKYEHIHWMREEGCIPLLCSSRCCFKNRLKYNLAIRRWVRMTMFVRFFIRSLLALLGEVCQSLL